MEKLNYYLTQKLMGIICFLLTYMSCEYLGDGTIGIIFVPLGLFMLFSKEMILDNEYSRKMRGEE